ncbi:cell division protein FtsQ/DivIB, partial [Pseudonocardia petroleophila]|uniref:cell division protein FtsQ/DivIB n=1 Tax=Pseudonocardia petroleophila TaxID=37331 RepID=UPI0035EEF5B8
RTATDRTATDRTATDRTAGGRSGGDRTGGARTPGDRRAAGRAGGRPAGGRTGPEPAGRAGRRPARADGRPRTRDAEAAGDDRPPRPRPEPSPVHRRRRRVAAGIAALLLLGVLAVGVRVVVYDLGLFDVEGVEVSGALDVPQADVLAAAAVLPGGPLAGVDTAGIAQRVAQLPGIGSVEVGRGWPHTVTIVIVERTAVAVVQTPQGPMPVDASGVVYPAPVPPGLPQLTFGAAGPDDPSTRAALDVLSALPEDVRGQVATVDAVIGGGVPQVTLGLSEDRQVRWGPAEESVRKASVLVALLTQPGRVYDVTSPALPTVRS